MVTYLIFWGILFAVTVIAELLTLQLVSIWFAVGSMGAFAAAFCDVGFTGQLGIFVAVSLVLLLVTRPLLRKMRVKGQPAMNADKNIGSTAVVLEDIDTALGTGRVRSAGVDWMAVSQTGDRIPKDTIVVITGVEGAKLFVCREDRT